MDVRKIALMKELKRRIEIWKKYEKISWKDFSSKIETQDAIAYNMLVAIQTAIDLGNLIIEEKNFPPASTYADVFKILCENKIINGKLAKNLMWLARFRNVLAHLYWTIDLKKVYQVLKNGRKYLENFLKVVHNVKI